MNRNIAIPFMTVFIGVFFPLHTFAQTTEVPTESVAALLAKVKESQGDARRKAMNALKLKLRTVNAATRAKTMQDLRNAFGGKAYHAGHPQIPHGSVQRQINRQQQTNPPRQTNPGQKPPVPQPPQHIPKGRH